MPPTTPHPALALCARVLVLALLCGLQGVLPAAAASADPAAARTTGPGDPAQVLVITGTDPYLPAFVAIDAAMRAAIAQRHPRPVVWLYESIDSLRLAGATGPVLAELLARKYEGVRIDTVVLVSEPAVEFYLRYRDRLWPRVSTVYDWVAPDFARALPPDAAMSGIPAASDFAGTLRIAQALQPEARRLVVVGGVSRFDEVLLRATRAALGSLRERLEVEFLTGPSLQAVAARLAREDTGTIVLYTTLFRDAAGQVYVQRDALGTIAAASRAPIYGIFETYLGHGLVAGAMDSFAGHGDRLGDLVARALDGRLSGEPIVQPAPPSSCLVDGRQLLRFGLSPRAAVDDVALARPVLASLVPAQRLGRKQRSADCTRRRHPGLNASPQHVRPVGKVENAACCWLHALDQGLKVNTTTLSAGARPRNRCRCGPGSSAATAAAAPSCPRCGSCHPPASSCDRPANGSSCAAGSRQRGMTQPSRWQWAILSGSSLAMPQ